MIDSSRDDSEPWFSELVSVPIPFGYWPSLPNLNPLYDEHERLGHHHSTALPGLKWSNDHDDLVTESDWQERSVVYGFGEPEAAARSRLSSSISVSRAATARASTSKGRPATRAWPRTAQRLGCGSATTTPSEAPWNSSALLAVRGVLTDTGPNGAANDFGEPHKRTFVEPTTGMEAAGIEPTHRLVRRGPIPHRERDRASRRGTPPADT